MQSLARVLILSISCSMLSLLLPLAASAQIRILAPNGGERFRVGSSTTIRWAGVEPTDTVTLEYSIDNGANWNLITNRGLGLQHAWTSIPNTPSDFCLMRATTKPTVGDSVKWLRSAPTPLAFPQAIHYAEFSPDGTRVIGGGAEGDVFIWDSFTGQLITSFSVEKRADFPSPPAPAGITLISCIRYSPDGRFFATISPLPGNTGSTIRIFDAATNAEVRRWVQNEGFFGSSSASCDYSPDGTRLLVTGTGGGRVYTVADGSLVTQLKGYIITGTTGSMGDGDWNSTGTAIIGISSGAPIPEYILSNPVTGDVINSYPFPAYDILNSVRFNPDGTRFISTAVDGITHVHDVATGTEVLSLNNYDRFPNAAEYSSDGRFFATAGQDNGSPNWKLKLYDAATGAFVRTVGAIGNGMRNLAFSPDGARILVSCIDGVRIFQSPQSSPGQSDVSDSLWSIFVTSGEFVVVRAGTVTASQGELVDVPIIIDNPGTALGAGATRIDLTLRYNVSLLDPTGSTPRGTHDPVERSIPLSFPLTSSTDTLLGMLHFKAALGNDSTTILDLSNATANTASLTVIEEDGLFRLRDLCYEGGARLLNPNGTVGLKIVARDARSSWADADLETIEEGRTELELVDINGRLIRSYINGEAPSGRWRMRIDLGDVPTGRYFLVLRTRTVQKIVRLEVAR